MATMNSGTVNRQLDQAWVFNPCLGGLMLSVGKRYFLERFAVGGVFIPRVHLTTKHLKKRVMPTACIEGPCVVYL
jgi:hypothetical protein